jgi:unsaturated chondroitin disaccharide hydrolase
MLIIDASLTAEQLRAAATRVFEVSAPKIRDLFATWDEAKGAPVITAGGKYITRGWTEWTLGFHYGSALLQFEATGDAEFLRLGREGTLRGLSSHLSHTGIHDHGFHIVSTFGNLLRMMREGAIAEDARERETLELALKVSGAVQAARWTELGGGRGFIHSFNGPHSLFIDTMRTLRSLALAHALGQELLGESDTRVNLLARLLRHAETTARFNVYYGEGRDIYDVPGRVAHEAIFNRTDGTFRCPSSQQGYSPFTTWTRGLAWALCGFAEQLEYLHAMPDAAFAPGEDRGAALALFERAARVVAEYYIASTPTDGIPYWDTGAPGLHAIRDALVRPSAPHNEHEPVDSSAASIAAQGFLRLGRCAGLAGHTQGAGRYTRAGQTIAHRLFTAPYLSMDAGHQGLILHSVYHRPNGWDHIPPGCVIPCNEASQWGDYHARELALMLLRSTGGREHQTFFSGII